MEEGSGIVRVTEIKDALQCLKATALNVPVELLQLPGMQ